MATAIVLIKAETNRIPHMAGIEEVFRLPDATISLLWSKLGKVKISLT
jgi:hypothetical protein